MGKQDAPKKVELKIMKNKFDIPQLFLRLALGIGFLLPVMDRLGWFGAPGAPGVGWGNWSTFIDYTHTLMPYLSRSMTNVVATSATVGEIIFGITLIVGYKTTVAARGSCLLTLLFALSMFFFEGPRDRKSTRLNSSHGGISRMPSSA